jgi:hypothetical protein
LKISSYNQKGLGQEERLRIFKTYLKGDARLYMKGIMEMKYGHLKKQDK